MELKIKRVYDAPEKGDGIRILVDRVWPRGMKKDAAAIDLWLREIAPTAELRKWFNHDDEKWEEFRNRYYKELENNQEHVSRLRKELKKETVTLVYAAKNKEHNQAVVIKEFLQKPSIGVR